MQRAGRGKGRRRIHAYSSTPRRLPLCLDRRSPLSGPSFAPLSAPSRAPLSAPSRAPLSGPSLAPLSRLSLARPFLRLGADAWSVLDCVARTQVQPERLLGNVGDSEDEQRKVRAKLPYRHRNMSAASLQSAITTGPCRCTPRNAGLWSRGLVVVADQKPTLFGVGRVCRPRPHAPAPVAEPASRRAGLLAVPRWYVFRHHHHHHHIPRPPACPRGTRH